MSSQQIEFKKLFPNKHIPIILSAIFEVGDDLHKKSQTDLENRITTRLLARLTRIPPFRDGPLDIRSQADLVSPDDDNIEADTPEGSIDLIVTCGMGYHVYFAIEAKRLRVKYDKGRLNTGSDKHVNEGMMRFISCQYASRMITSAMLGYVFDGQVNKARTGVDNYIQKKIKKLKLKPPKKLIQSEILLDNPVYETLHNLKGRHFTIYHIFIAV